MEGDSSRKMAALAVDDSALIQFKPWSVLTSFRPGCGRVFICISYFGSILTVVTDILQFVDIYLIKTSRTHLVCVTVCILRVTDQKQLATVHTLRVVANPVTEVSRKATKLDSLTAPSAGQLADCYCNSRICP